MRLRVRETVSNVPVILSGVTASRGEAVAQSKDPCLSSRRFEVRDPSTPPIHSQANGRAPLRMTEGKELI